MRLIKDSVSNKHKPDPVVLKTNSETGYQVSGNIVWLIVKNYNSHEYPTHIFLGII